MFEMMAKGNVDTLDRYGVKKIVTSCPHCFNTFKPTSTPTSVGRL